MTGFTADTTDFDQMCRELAVIASVPPEQVMREEVGKVLSQAITNTDAADASKIKAHSENAQFALLPASLYTPKGTAKKAVRMRGSMVLYSLKRRYPSKLWVAIQKARAVDLKRRLAARGLAKQSWYKLGTLLGLSVTAPEYVKKAIATTGKTYQDETVKVQINKGGMSITIQNSQPTVNAIGGEQALDRAISGREKFFVANIARHVFDSIESAAKKYPGIFTK